MLTKLDFLHHAGGCGFILALAAIAIVAAVGLGFLVAKLFW